MVALGQIVNADEIPARDDFSPFPPGIYTGMITASEMKATKNGKGEMLVLEIDVLDNGAEGRKLFERLNIKNENDKAVEIAYKTLGEIIRAVGKTTIKDSNELHNKRMTLTVEVEAAKPYTKDGVEQPGNAQNKVKKYSLLGTVEQGPAKAAAPAAAAPAPEAKAALPPWKRTA